MVLLTRRVKFFFAIRPPCCAKEPPPAGYRLYIRHEKASAVGGSFARQGGLITQKVSFFVQLEHFRTKNTGWSIIIEAVVLNKLMAKMCHLI